jgi:hypothetical protein
MMWSGEMFSNHKVFVLVAAMCVMAQGCANMSILQTAETLEPGAVRVHGGVGAYGGRGLDSVHYEVGWRSCSPELWLPLLEVGLRYGLVKSLDIGLKYSVGGHLALDLKQELFDGSDVTLSIGLGAGYSPTMLYYDGYRLLDNVWDLALPLYGSVRIDDLLTIYGAARPVLRMATTVENDIDAVGHLFLGVTAGLKVGEQMGGLAEVAYIHGFHTFNAGQLNVGLFLEL